MIVKLHGTSGSGKSSVARDLMEWCTPEPIRGNVLKTDRPEAYKLNIVHLSAPLYILGPYETACGGLDALGSADDHIRLLLEYGPQGHVFYEGLLQSGFYGRIGVASERFGDAHIFAFLDTPLNTCLQRVMARRTARGTTTEFNPTNTVDKYHAIRRLKSRLEAGDKCPVRKTAMIDHRLADEQVMRLFHD